MVSILLYHIQNFCEILALKNKIIIGPTVYSLSSSALLGCSQYCVVMCDIFRLQLIAVAVLPVCRLMSHFT